MAQDIIEILKTKNINCTQQQQEAIKHVDGPALVLAVPGSGKTTVIMGRIGNLIMNHNVKADSILAITFSKASAIDMTKRFETTFKNEGLGRVNFSTIHAFGNWVVTNYNRRFGINTRLITGKEALSAIKSSYTKSTGKYLTEDSLEGYVVAIGYIKNRMLSDEQVEDFAKSSGLVAFLDVLDGYEQYKKDNNLYDYDDMLLKAIDILKANKVTLDYIKQKYQYIMLDEGQDTSVLQYELLKLIVNDKVNFYEVADDDQSIYGFRGAYSEILLNINDIFPNTKLYFMEQNFRSKGNIANVANTLIKNNENRFKKTIYTDKEDGDKIDIVHTEDITSQVDYVLKNLDPEGKTTAVLYRNNISMIPLANRLKSKNVEFCAGSYKPGFFNHWVTHDIIAMVRLLLNEGDIKSFSKIYYKIETFLTKKTIKDLSAINNKCNSVLNFLLDNYQLTSYQKDNIRRVRAAFKRARKLPPHKGLEHLAIHLGYFDYLERNGHENNTSSSAHIAIVETIIEIAKNVEKYEDIENEMNNLNEYLNNSRNKVHSNLFLSTIHSSKGLEFDEVFILDVNEGTLPNINEEKMSQDESIEMLEADRNLLYVGITRAKKSLKIISSDKPSRYIKEITSKNKSVNIVRA